MFGPKLSALTILCGIKGHTRAALVFTKRISHGCDGLHRALVTHVLRLNRDNTVVVVKVSVRVHCTHGCVLLLDLLLRVEVEYKVGGTMCRHLRFVEPAGQDWQLSFIAREVAAAKQVLVFGSDLGVLADRIGEVIDE